MSQRKEKQAVEGQPPTGPNGELQFHQEMQKLEDQGKRDRQDKKGGDGVSWGHFCFCLL